MYAFQHINIVTLLAVVVEIGHYGVVMEHVLHGALDEFILSNPV